MSVFDKFENKNITKVQNGYAEDIPSLFNDIIKFQFKNKEEIKKIHLSLLEYVNSKSPVFFLRLYGSYAKTKYHLQRRGFLSEYKDNTKLSYCDNTFTLLFAGMKLAGIPYTCKDLEQLFNQNKLIVGFGQVSEEKELSFYTPKGAKRANLNAKGWYQAHIKPTGYGYNDLNLMKLFPNPDRELFQMPNNIRQVNDLLTNEQVEILRAHFLRLIHPFNSFLVPKRNHIEYNGNNIGEENELINYVRNFLEKSFPKEYKEFDLQSIKYIVPKSNNVIGGIKWFENPKNKSNPKTINMKIRDNKFKKSDAITLINNKLGTDKLSNTNTVYSNINKTAPCWWLNISPSKFKNLLNILLVEEDELIWIYLPKDCCYPPEDIFNTRNDNGKVDLRIGTEEPDYLKDYLSYNNFDFKPHVKNRLKIV